MLRTTAALVGFLTALCFPLAAWAEARRIALLKPDTELLRAVSLALGPWGIETLSSDAPLPESSQPEAAQVASQLARHLDVEALVWITTLDRGSLLWVFDVRTGDITTRLLSQTPPFDGARAAAVALSVKTVLRATVVAPPAERFGVQPVPPSHSPAPEEHPVSTEERSLSALELGAGSHWIGEGRRDYRIRLGALVWFSKLKHLGLSMQLSSGPGLGIDHPDYSGRYREYAAGVGARFRVLDLPGFSTLVGLGAAAHWTTLRGTLTADSQESNVSRLNGSLELETALNVNVTRGFYLGASIGTAYTPTYRRYLVGGHPIFSPWPLTANLMGYCGAALF